MYKWIPENNIFLFNNNVTKIQLECIKAIKGIINNLQFRILNNILLNNLLLITSQ